MLSQRSRRDNEFALPVVIIGRRLGGPVKVGDASVQASCQVPLSKVSPRVRRRRRLRPAMRWWSQELFLTTPR